MFMSGLMTTLENQWTVNSCTLCTTKHLWWRTTDKNLSCIVEPQTWCKTIDNCLTTVCFENSAGTNSYGCRMCSKDYSGSDWDTVNRSGSGSCKKMNSIQNCEFVRQTGVSSYECYACKWNYAVLGGTMCASYTENIACRTIKDGMCNFCYHAYYFDGDWCRLGANLTRNSIVSLVFGIVALIFIGWQN